VANDLNILIGGPWAANTKPILQGRVAIKCGQGGQIMYLNFNSPLFNTSKILKLVTWISGTNEIERRRYQDISHHHFMEQV